MADYLQRERERKREREREREKERERERKREQGFLCYIYLDRYTDLRWQTNKGK